MRDCAPRRHCIISGTGRAGTSFLVHLLTELGLDTGFKPGTISEISGHLDKVAWAGLEHDLKRGGAPYIVKSPHFCDRIEELANDPGLRIDHAIVPVRDLEAAALSRMKVQERHSERRSFSPPGGLWDAASLAEQRDVLARKQYQLLYHLVRMDVPITFLHFPRSALDWRYTQSKLAAIFSLEHSDAEFQRVFENVSRPERIDRAVPEPDRRPRDRAPRRDHWRGLLRLNTSGR